MGAKGLFLFGSTARDQATRESDLDLFLDLDPTSRFNLLDLAETKMMVEEELGISVDVAIRDALHPLMRDEIERR